MSWKNAALAKSVIITDAWEVTKTYAGRIAEWVLFACMIMNIIEMLPGIHLDTIITNTVLGVQVVMLDVGGFSLASMADHARANGDEEAANKAETTGKFLIGIMIVTLLLVAIGLLFPPAKQYTDMAEKGLILVRVVMTVVYSHVIHSLRRAETTMINLDTHAQIAAISEQFSETINTLTGNFAQQIQHLTDELSRMENTLQNRLNESSAMMENTLQNTLQQEIATIYERLQNGRDESSALKMLQGELQENLQKIEVTLQGMQVEKNQPQKHAERPLLHVVPSPQPASSVQASVASSDTKFNARAFVFASLQGDASLKLADLAKLALLQGTELSESTISRYRKEFFASHESSAM